MASAITRGVIFVHAVPKAMCPHVQWAVASVLGVPVQLDWVDQPAIPGFMRAEASWQGIAGTGSQLVTGMNGWEHLRFEVTEDPSYGSDGSRWSYTPSLGIYYAQTDVHGNIVVPENTVRRALEQSYDAYRLRHELDLALGKPWDDELEPFRYAGQGAPVRWLHRVG